MPIEDTQQEAISDDAHGHGYTPSVPIDWPDPKPKTVGDALDSTSATGLKHIHEDLTPQLGGNLDVNGKTISNVLGDLRLIPNANGDLILFDTADVGDGENGRELRIWRKAAEGDGYLRFYISDNHVTMIHSDHSIVMQVAATRYIKLNSKGHLYLDLGDNAGANELKIRNSSSQDVATIDSNGNALFGGTLGISGALNFNHFKAIAMICDKGATLPTAPPALLDGRWFLHTPVGRSILYQYCDTHWCPIISFGSMTVYVDNTDGTDDPDLGTAVDASAFKTVQYAVDQIPGLVGGDVAININAETYAETVTIQGKNFTGNYRITLTGILVSQESNPVDGGTKGVGATQANIIDVGAFAGDSYANMLVIDSGNDEYRIIDSHDNDTLTLTGTLTNNPSGTWTVYDWGTIVNEFAIMGGQKAVYIEDIELNGSASDAAVIVDRHSYVELLQCHLKGTNRAVDLLNFGYAQLTTCYVSPTNNHGVRVLYGTLDVGKSKFFAGGNARIAIYTYGGIVYVFDGSIIDNWDHSVGALEMDRNAVVSLYGSSAGGYNRIRNCVLGVRAWWGGIVTSANNVQYSGNTTDEDYATGTEYHGWIQ